MLRVLFSAVLVTVLAACESAPVDPAAARVSMLKTLGLDPDAVVHDDRVRYSVGPANPTAFTSGLYVQTRTDLYLYRQSKENAKVLEPDVSFPLEKLQYAGLEEWSHTHLKQLHLGSPSGLIVVNFHDQPDAMAGDPDQTDAAYAALMSAGVRPGPAGGHVWPMQAVKPYAEVYPVGDPAKPEHAKSGEQEKPAGGH